MEDKKQMTNILPGYLNYMALFIGAGFLSGSIVHIPLNPIKFGFIGLIGVALFVSSTVVKNSRSRSLNPATKTSLLKLIGYSSVLAIGVGMISGGIQHFSEFPDYLKVIIPIGVALSIIGYILTQGITLNTSQKLKIASAIFVVTAIVAMSLGAYSNQLLSNDTDTSPNTDTSEKNREDSIPEPRDGHGHAH